MKYIAFKILLYFRSPPLLFSTSYRIIQVKKEGRFVDSEKQLGPGLMFLNVPMVSPVPH